MMMQDDVTRPAIEALTTNTALIDGNPLMQFLLILIIILLVPILFDKLKAPALLGLIIAGTLIGPKGLNIMDRDVSFDLFGTAGLLFIMFLAGLDTNITEFKRNSKKSSVFGILTFLLPFGMSALVSYFFFGLPIVPSVLIGAMIAPHTPITYPIVTKFNIQKDPAVSVALGGTLITNIISFIIIIVVVGMSGGKINSEFWIRLSVSSLIFAGIIAFVFPLVTRWFFKRFQDNVLQFIFVLVMMFMGAFIAELAHIEKIIGTLFAGITLNRLIPRTSPLMNRINFVANSIFIPFFLIGVGMLVDPRAFVQDIPTIKVAVLLTAVAIFSKYLAAWLTQKALGMSKDQGNVLNGLSSAQAASTLAVVMVGYELGLLDDAILNGSLIMILISCTTSALYTQAGARNIAAAEAGQAAENTQKLYETENDERILISVSNKQTVEELVNLSTLVKTQSARNGIYALNIINSNHSDVTDDKNAQQLLELANDVAAATDNRINPLIRYDVNIVNGITNVIKENRITDLVLGIYKGISKSFIGNLNEGILQKSNVTTLVYQSAQPIATIKKHHVFVPPQAEKEVGFPHWLLKIWNISRNSGVPLAFYGERSTLEYMRKINEKYPIPCEFEVFSEWNNFSVLSQKVQSDDNLIIVMSRKNGITYRSYMNRIPDYLNQYFRKQSFIVIYPVQLGIGELNTSYRVDEIGYNIAQLFQASRG